MKKFATLSVIALLLCGLGGYAIAQDVPVQPSPDAAAVAVPESGAVVAQPAAADGEQLSLDEYIEAFKFIISQWETLGWLAGLVALVAFLVMLMKIKFINDYLEEHDLKWVKGLVAAVLGGVGAMFAAVQAGAPWWPGGVIAFLSGAIAGWGAVGVHQTVTKGNKLKK